MQRIYLDHNASTPTDRRVVQAMLPWLEGGHGNPSSLHFEGREARRAVEDAREEIAALLGAEPDEIVFTSGATEANNLAVHAAFARAARPRARIACTAIEHPSVHEAIRRRAGREPETVELPVDREGRVDPAVLDELLRDGADLLAVIVASNEIGTVQPWNAMAAWAAAKAVPLHLDAVQALGRIPFDVSGLGPATASFSGHKIGGPKGAGVLFVRRELRVEPLFSGGPQERGRRAGTENVAAIVGLATAIRLAVAEQAARARALEAAERRFLEAVRRALPEISDNGPKEGTPRLPGTLNLRISGLFGEYVLLALDRAGVAVSLGSACASGAAEPSPVLAAVGLSRVENLESFRVSFGWATPASEIDRAAELLAEVAARGARR